MFALTHVLSQKLGLSGTLDHTNGIGTIDGFKECGSGWMHTLRGKTPLRIDYIFHDKDYEGLSYYMKELSYSDHYPVFMKIALK